MMELEKMNKYLAAIKMNRRCWFTLKKLFLTYIKLKELHQSNIAIVTISELSPVITVNL